VISGEDKMFSRGSGSSGTVLAEDGLPASLSVTSGAPAVRCTGCLLPYAPCICELEQTVRSE
jgi:hypothetical protein